MCMMCTVAMDDLSKHSCIWYKYNDVKMKRYFDFWKDIQKCNQIIFKETKQKIDVRMTQIFKCN